MLRASLGAAPTGIAKLGCSDRSVGQTYRPGLERQGFVCARLLIASHGFSWLIAAPRG
jgi:hypothetical protein